LNRLSITVPSSTLHEKTVDRNSVLFDKIISLFVAFFQFCYRVGKGERVNRYLILPRMVLQNARQKSLGKKEAGKPKCCRLPLLGPVTYKLNSFVKIFNPRGQRFQGRICRISPCFRYLSDNNSFRHSNAVFFQKKSILH
jgi:hypothetical protein